MSEPGLSKGVILNNVTPTEVNAAEGEQEEAGEDVIAKYCEITVIAGFLKILGFLVVEISRFKGLLKEF